MTPSTVTITLITPNEESKYDEYNHELGKYTLSVTGTCHKEDLEKLFTCAETVGSKKETIDADPESIYFMFSNISFMPGAYVIIKLNNDYSEILSTMSEIVQTMMFNNHAYANKCSEIGRFLHRFSVWKNSENVINWREEDETIKATARVSKSGVKIF